MGFMAGITKVFRWVLLDWIAAVGGAQPET